jgi:hypothetical protein
VRADEEGNRVPEEESRATGEGAGVAGQRVWAALINADTEDEEVLGVFTTELLALEGANRVSPEAADAAPFVLDEMPEWVEGFEEDRDAGLLGNGGRPFGEILKEEEEQKGEERFRLARPRGLELLGQNGLVDTQEEEEEVEVDYEDEDEDEDEGEGEEEDGL